MSSLNYHWSLKFIEAFARMINDVICLETYKTAKTMHCSKTWINLHRFLEFANTLILLKTCPGLSWDQALLSFSWVNRFQAGKANRKFSHLVHYLFSWITCACESNVIMIVASLACALTWLPWHHTDLKLNNRAFAATWHAYFSEELRNLKNVDRLRKIALYS